MAEMHWTSGQQQCIDARGGTVLVSAAAGSGKTAVLIERIISLLCDENDPLSVDSLLVVTFTKAAAAEMRSRLGSRLARLLAKDPHNRHLLRQQMLLPQATICTIDSFCAQLLREQAAKVGISPRFRVGEDTALRVMKSETADRVINEAYAKGDPDFLKLCDLLSGDRGDGHLAEQLLRTYEFIQAHPFPDKWLQQQQDHFETLCPVKDTIWGEILLSQACRDLQAAQCVLARALEEMATDERMQAAYGGSVSVSLHAIIEAIDAAGNDWDTAVEAIRRIDFPRVKPLRGYEDAAFKAHIAALREYAKKLIEEHVKPLCAISEATAESDIRTAAPLVRALFDLIRAFSKAFTAAKARQNLLDFNDMEHLALSLLAVPNENGGFTRTEAAVEIGARFSHIMVDEYQDTNATQDTLFSALSNNEENLFFVGDIKQSIYGFRQAMPSIFRKRREQGTPYNAVDFPASITLGNNFRSRRQVTESVNFFFRRWMHEETGDIVYDEREELVSSATFEHADDSAYDTELLVIDKKNAADDLSAHEAQARLIGRRIRTMLSEGYLVTDKEGLRRAEYRDICILLRSTGRVAPTYVKVLQSMGIPVNSGARDEFFECSEIRAVLSILRAIDNPLMDISLIAALLSPIFGFSPDDLAELRRIGRDIRFYTALKRVAKDSAHPLYAKSRIVLDTLDRYRLLSASLPVDQLIRRLYEDTDMLSIMSTKSGGSGRAANLRQLYDLARHFEQEDLRGLSAFVRYLNRLEQKGIAVSAAAKDSAGSNAVQLMTIHRSKGLEFPIVFVAGLGSMFNNASTKEDVLLHADHGIGLMLRDREALVQSDAIHRRALATAITYSERTEELRVLYVAMTRAKDKLILLTTVDSLQSTLERLTIAAGDDEPLPAACVLRASRMSDWVLAAALHHPAGEILHAARLGDTKGDSHADGLYIRLVQAEDLEQDAQIEDSMAPPAVLPDIEHRLPYVYPYAALSMIPAKMTASGAAHLGQNHFSDTLSRPAFLSKTGLSPAERGTATHIFLEHAILHGSLSAVEQADTMVERELLTKAQMNALHLSRLDRFLQSDLAARMAASPLLLREFPFAVECPLSVTGADLSSLPIDALSETILVQGIADALFEEDGALVIVDYKTDRVDRGDELAARYRAQLAIYKDALSRTLQRPVKECVIYSFHLGEVVAVDTK